MFFTKLTNCLPSSMNEVIAIIGLLDHSAKKRPVAQRDVDGDLPNRPAKRMKGATDEKMKTVPSSRTKTASVTGKGAKSTTVKTTKATTTKTSTKPKPK